MNWESLSSIVMNAAVIAAIVTSIVNAVIALINTHTLNSIEKLRYNSSITQYRYSKLYELLCDWAECIRNIEPPQNRDTELSEKEQADFLNEASRILKEKYDIAYPLIEKNLLENMEQLLKELSDKQNACYIWIEADNKPTYRTVDLGDGLIDYHQCYLKVKEQFELIIYTQLQRLLSM